MPSSTHEALLLLFRNRPELAPELLREALHLELPPYAEVRIESADLTDLQPAEYRADLVVLLYDDRPVLGIVIEVQLSVDPHKRYAWPVYAVGLRARMRCPVCVLVVTPHEHLVRWASEPIDLGGGNRFMPFVLGPSAVPAVTDLQRADATPELAVLSAMSHGRGADIDRALQIAIAAMTASVKLDPSRSVLYYDLVYASLSEAARVSLQAMDPAKYEFQSEFAKRYLSQGRAEGHAEGRLEGRAEGRLEGQAEGRLEGRAEQLITLLTLKFGALDESVVQRIRLASLDELEVCVTRVLTAASLEDALRRE